MRVCRIILTFIVVAASHNAFAHDGFESCRADLKTRTFLSLVDRSGLFADTRIFAGPVLDAESKQKIIGLLAKQKPNASDFARVREIYFEARLAMLSPELSALVRANPIKMDFSEGVEADQNRITVPEAFADTVLPTLLWAHELEHVIQFALLGMYTPEQITFAKELSSVLTIALDPRARYWGEYGAMLGEWEILNVVPRALIEDARRVLKARPEPESNYVVKRLKQQFMNLQSIGTREAYVRAQHAAGRYSMSDFSKGAFAYSALTTGTGAALVFAYQLFCSFLR